MGEQQHKFKPVTIRDQDALATIHRYALANDRKFANAAACIIQDAEQGFFEGEPDSVLTVKRGLRNSFLSRMVKK